MLIIFSCQYTGWLKKRQVCIVINGRLCTKGVNSGEVHRRTNCTTMYAKCMKCMSTYSVAGVLVNS